MQVEAAQVTTDELRQDRAMWSSGSEQAKRRLGSGRGKGGAARAAAVMPHLINPLDDCSVPLCGRKEHIDDIKWLHSLGLLECGPLHVYYYIVRCKQVSIPYGVPHEGPE